MNEKLGIRINTLLKDDMDLAMVAAILADEPDYDLIYYTLMQTMAYAMDRGYKFGKGACLEDEAWT